MANALQLRRGTTAQHSSFTGLAGEVTVDTDKNVVVVHDGSTAGGAPLATESSIAGKLDASGGAVTGDITFGDNNKAIFGAGSDLQIYHDTTASRIVDVGTGSLKIQAEAFAVNNVGDTENMITANPDGAVSLFYDGSTKLATTVTGIDVTGTVTADGLTLGDNEKIQLGAGNDLEIYHDGSNSRIADAGTGNLYLEADAQFRVIKPTTEEVMIKALTDGAVTLYYDNAEKLVTTADGISVTGSTQETDYSLTGTDIDPANGGVQYKTFAGNTTFTESLADGQAVVLHLSGGASYTITWPTMTWVGADGNTEPTLTANDVIVIWQSNGTVYGAHVGSAA